MSMGTHFLYSETNLSEFANNVKEHLLRALANEGHLKGDPEEIGGNLAVVVYSKGILGKLWDKLRGLDPKNDNLCLSIIKGIKSTNKSKEKDGHS